MRACPACTKQMVKHGLTRSEINLHFASKSHNHVIIPSIGEEQVPGSCFLLGHFARQDGARGSDPALLLLQGTLTVMGPTGLWPPAQCPVGGVGRGPGMWEQQLPITPHTPSSLALGFSTLCQGSPVGNTSQSTFPHPLAQHRSKPSPVTPSSYQ